MATASFQQLLNKLASVTSKQVYFDAFLDVAHKQSLYKAMNNIRGLNDEYAAHVLQIFNLKLRGDEGRAQILIDMLWDVIHDG